MSNRRDFLKKASLATIVSGIAPVWANAKSLDAPIADRSRALRIAHITDVHLLDRLNAEKCYARVLMEINAMPDKPDLIINTGDSVMDENKEKPETIETRWNVWNRIVKAENNLEMKSALGNHDVWYGPNPVLDAQYKKDKRYGKQWAIDELKLPNRFYAFEKKGWKFIALDSINGDNGYQLDDEQFTWLKQELQKSPSTPVCVFNHVPILSLGALLYSTKRKPLKDVKFPSGDMHNDHQRIKDLFFEHKQVKLCLSGHVHYVDAIEYLGVKYLCNGAVSGNWWGNPLSLDEFAPVYAIIDLYKDGSSEYRMVHYDVTI